MKYLQSKSVFEHVHYKIFEDNISDYAKEITEYETIKDYLKDIFLELEDDGFDIDIEGRWIRTQEFEELTGYEVKIKRNTNFAFFLLEDIYDYILTCKSYLKEMGFFITEINGNIPVRQERYGLDYSIGLHESDPEKFKLFDKPLISLEFKIRKSK